MCGIMAILINAPVYKHHQSEATELPGQRSCCVDVKVYSCSVGKQKYLRSVLVRHWRGQDFGRVFINLRLAANTLNSSDFLGVSNINVIFEKNEESEISEC